MVDRDRRTDPEVDYLAESRLWCLMWLEVENLFLLEGVIKAGEASALKSRQGFLKSCLEIEKEFRRHFDEQVLQHVRHRVKREVECKIDARFSCITAMEYISSQPYQYAKAASAVYRAEVAVCRIS